MKAPFPICAALLLAAVPFAALASEPSGATTTGVDPTNPSGGAPTVAQPAPEMPAETAPSPSKKPDPALDLLPAQPGQIVPEPTLTPDSPNGPAVKPAPSANGKSKSGKTEAVELDLALRIRYRQAKTRALEDAAVQAEWHNSLIARTDLLRREALTRYYKLLFARMLKTDSSIQKLVDTAQAFSVRRLEQTRISPTEALDANESSRSGYLAAPFTSDQF